MQLVQVRTLRAHLARTWMWVCRARGKRMVRQVNRGGCMVSGGLPSGSYFTSFCKWFIYVSTFFRYSFTGFVILSRLWKLISLLLVKVP